MKKCNICKSEDRQKFLYTKDGFDLIKCENCSFVYLNPKSQAEDKVDEYYLDVFKKNSLTAQEIHPTNQKRLNNLFERFEKLVKKGILLDIGCHYGNMLKIAKNRGWDVEGLEPFKEIEEYGRSIGIKMYGKDLLECKFESNKYNLITISEVVEHIKNPVEEIEEIYRILAPGGVLYLTTPNYDSLMRYMLGRNWDIIYPEHVCYFSHKTIIKMLKAIGFEIIDSRCDNFYPNVVLQKYKSRFIKKSKLVTSNFDSNYAFRDFIENKNVFVKVKNLINFFLNGLKLGSDMKVIARKPL